MAIGNPSIHAINPSWVSPGASPSQCLRHTFEQNVLFPNVCLRPSGGGVNRGAMWTASDLGISCVPQPWHFTADGPRGHTTMDTPELPSAQTPMSCVIGPLRPYEHLTSQQAVGRAAALRRVPRAVSSNPLLFQVGGLAGKRLVRPPPVLRRIRRGEMPDRSPLQIGRSGGRLSDTPNYGHCG